MKYFTQQEFDIVCTTPASLLPNQHYLVERVLDPTREHLNMPIRITCGYRSVEWDKAKGRSGNSQHTKAEAADFQCKDKKAAFVHILNNCPFDQLIWECGNSNQPQWIHVSLKRTGTNRGQILYYDGRRYSTPDWLLALKKKTEPQP